MSVAVAIVVKNPDGFMAPWKTSGIAVGIYVRKLAQALRTEQRKTIPVGEPHVHPKSRYQRKKLGAGSMQASIFVRYTGKGFASVGTVGTSAAHAKFVTWGTRPHAIQYRAAKVLTIWAPDAPDADEFGFIFRRRVNHPGTKKNDWRTPAAQKALKKADKIWLRSVTAALKKGEGAITEWGAAAVSGDAPDVGIMGGQ